ncbi:MAG: amidophosphoribosyltransferase, partial [Thermoprotei archaeon]
SLEVARVRSRATPTPCIFEYVYFSRPDSFFNGVQVHEARVRMGMELARVAPVDADVVIPVPDSGRSAALGFSRASGIPMDEGLMRNRYVGRSFIMPPGLRELISSIKYGVVRRVVEGRRVVVVDDSLIRGTTMRSIVSLLRRFGAREVHVRIASPPVRYPCFMGIDFPTRRELIASKLGSVEEVARAIGADSLAYNTLEGLLRAVGLPSLCTACFSGTYPFPNLNLEALEKSFARVVA